MTGPMRNTAPYIAKAKMTRAQDQEMRRLRKDDPAVWTYAALAKRYKVSTITIKDRLENPNTICSDDMPRDPKDVGANRVAFLDVESSNVAQIAYNALTKELLVRFKGMTAGTTYAYDDVPTDKWEGLKVAASKGQYLNAEIKPIHPCRKLTDAQNNA